MKKQISFLPALTVLLLVTSLVGCKSPGHNPAGVYGSDAEYGLEGSIPMADRFTGGTEHPGMFDSVYFGYDSSQVSATERGKVELVADHLKANSDVAVIIEGHCDERGSREYNLALGERRALAVRTYLVGLGIGDERIQTKSFGEENPATSMHDESAWSRNRRGEFVLYY